MPQAKLPVIPEYITVHLGKPDQPAQNVQVPFTEYIKNVASSEIYPTWPENAIQANVYAIISYALNRIYTEWYRSKGYDFDITNSTQFDQAYVQGRDIFENISLIVDDIFNEYVRQKGSIEPYYTAFCNETTVTCDGLSQWGTVDLAKKGHTPFQILTHYYGDSIELVTNAPVQRIKESYPGVPLKLGMSGNDVKVIQGQLNRIRKNFPNIPKIQYADGNFGVETEDAVKEFQKTFNLLPDGIVGKGTWYKIKSIYNGVKQLSELTSEGIKYEEVLPLYEERIQRGMKGVEVEVLQYYIDVIAYFIDSIPLILIDGDFGEETENAVIAFQKTYGLTVDGVVGPQTWDKITEIYFDLIDALPQGYEGEGAEVYPGYILKYGMRDSNIEDIQKYLLFISQRETAIPKVSVTGYFGDQTLNAVKAIQKMYGLRQTGVVGPITWNAIAQRYNELKGV